MAQLDGMKVAILVAEGFEEAELLEPRKALEEAGADTFVVSPAEGEVQGWKHFDKGAKVKVDVPLDEADASAFDALVLPGGVANPDQLRTQPRAVQFVHEFFEAGKPVGVICHGPWTLIEAGPPDGWPFGALAGALFGALLLVLPKKPRRPMGFNTVRRRSVASGQDCQ